MGNLKDIIDLAKDLESRSKERKDIETLKQIHALAHEIQSKQLEVMERDIRLMEENAELKRKLNEENAELTRIEKGIEFRKGSRTNDRWDAFCPSCHLPVVHFGHKYKVRCSKKCGWVSEVYEIDLDAILSTMNA